MHLCSRFTGLETVSRYMMQGEDMEHGRIPCIVLVCVSVCLCVCMWMHGLLSEC